LPLEYKLGAGTLITVGAARDKPAWPLNDDDDDDVYFTAGVAEYKETAGDRFEYLTAGVTGVIFTTGPLAYEVTVGDKAVYLVTGEVYLTTTGAAGW
jgi:hypothetical protein